MTDKMISGLPIASAFTDGDRLELLQAGTNKQADVSLMGGRPSLMVAASDAPATIKARADYVCDGTADDVEIQAALEVLTGRGGTVELSAGTFNCVADIALPAISLRLVGHAMPGSVADTQATILIFNHPSTGDCIVPSNDLIPQEVAHLGLYGDGTETRYGIYVRHGVAYKVFRDIAIWNTASYGIEEESGCSQCYYDNIIFRELPAHCLHTAGQFSHYSHVLALRSSASGIAANADGFNIHSTNSVFVGCHAERYGNGFAIQSWSEGVTLIGCGTETCNSGIYIGGTEEAPAYGTTIIGGHLYSNQHTTNAAVQLVRSRGTTFIGLDIGTAVSSLGYSLNSYASDTLIMGGRIAPSIPISDGGTRTRVVSPYGYVTENHGAQASVMDGGTIVHGLSATPIVALVSGSVAGEIVTVSSLDGTNITVALKDNDGSAGTMQTVYWRAYV